jgi:hypothetical protein
LYDTQYNTIFPAPASDITPVDLVPKLSKIACTLQCTGIWVGGKGWGLTWKFIGGVVKPKTVEAVRGVCHVKLSDTDREELEKPETDDIDEEIPEVVKPSAPVVAQVKEPVSVVVDDSDDESPAVPETEPASQPESDVPSTPVVKTVVKKVVKKKVVA